MSDTVNYRPRNPAVTKSEMQLVLERLEALEMRVKELEAGGEPVTAKRGRPAKEKEE